MPSFSGNFNPLVGPLIQVAIFDVPPGSPPPNNLTNITVYQALIDTGATATCVSDQVAQDIGLKPVGKVPMIGATGQQFVNQYMFSVGFMAMQQQPNGTFAGQVTALGVTGLQFQKGSSIFDVLLGRDIICQGAFSISFDGHFVLSI